MTVKQIAEKYNLSPETVRTCIHRAGLPLRSGYPWNDYTDEQVELIVSKVKNRWKRHKIDGRIA